MRSIVPRLPGGGCSNIKMVSTNAERFCNCASNFISRVFMAVQTSVPSQLPDLAPDHKIKCTLITITENDRLKSFDTPAK